MITTILCYDVYMEKEVEPVASICLIYSETNEDLFITLENITNAKIYIYKMKYVDLLH